MTINVNKKNYEKLKIMKKTLLFLLLFSANTLLAAELFTINRSNTIVATKDSTNTIGLLLNQTFYQDILHGLCLVMPTLD